jgi:hypothetical protein
MLGVITGGVLSTGAETVRVKADVGAGPVISLESSLPEGEKLMLYLTT